MKVAFTLLALLPSLSWASFSDAAEENSGTLRGSSQPAAAPGQRGEEALSKNGCLLPHTFADCKSDNSTVRFSPFLQSNATKAQTSNFSCDARGLCRVHGDVGRVHTSQKPSTDPELTIDWQRWPGGMARLRVRGGVEGTTDYGSAVCVGFGRTPGEWTFLSCSHNFESGGEPELQLAGRWVPATLLYRDKLAEAVETAPGQYTRTAAGPDRSVLVVHWSGRLRFRPVCLERYVGQVALSGYPSSVRPVTIAGQTEEHPSAMKAALERPSQGGFSGGGVFTNDQELVGIWTSGTRGTGYGHYVAEFLPVFRQLGWAPGNWRLPDNSVAQQR